MTVETTNVDRIKVSCKNCRALCDESFHFCGRCGQRLRGSGPTVSAELLDISPASAHRVRQFHYLLVGSILCLVLLLGGGALSTLSYIHSQHSFGVNGTDSSTNGRSHSPEGIVWFYDQRGQGDAVALYLHGLPMLSEGRVYIAWLINPQRPDQVFPVGPLFPNKAGDVGFWSDQVPSFNPKILNLRLLFTQVMVTTENAITKVKSFTGPVVMQGKMNQKALDDITQLFVTASYTPDHQGLLLGVRSQMREESRWTANLLDALAHSDSNTLHTDLLRLIYIIQGAQGVDVQRLNIAKQQNVISGGDGFGLLSSHPNCVPSQHTCGYFDAIRIQVEKLFLQNALSKPAQQNILMTLDTLDQKTQSIQQQILGLVNFSKLDDATRQALIKLSTQIDALLNGMDRDGDGSIDPVPGEPGAAQLYTYLQQVGALKLT